MRQLSRLKQNPVAAWELARQEGTLDRLTVLCPTTMLGPILGTRRSYSLKVVQRMLHGESGLPRLGFGLVDVRDVALHISASERIVARPFLWLTEVADILRKLGPQAAQVPRRNLPDRLVRVAARFHPGLRSVSVDLGKRSEYSADKALRLPGWKPRPVDETIHDTARSLLASGSAD